MLPFSNRTLDFLTEVRMHDSKEWYEAHKAEYRETVAEPMIQLVEALAPLMLSIDPEIVIAPRVGGNVSRLRRDTRYTKDKHLYRSAVWCTFRHNRELWTQPPSFYFELRPDGMSLGCGYYETPPGIMRQIRELVLNDDPLWLAADRLLEPGTGLELYGDCFKRARYPKEPEQKQRWLNRKSLDIGLESTDFQLAFAPERLLEWIQEKFRLLIPAYEFYCAAHRRDGAETDKQKKTEPEQKPVRPADMW